MEKKLIQELDKLFPAHSIAAVSLEPWQEDEQPDFHFKITLTFKPQPNTTADATGQRKSLELYMVILPTREEIKESKVPNADKYKRMNQTWWSENGEITLSRYHQEYRELHFNNKEEERGEQGGTGEILGEIVKYPDASWVTDLILDRLAARVQAFANSVPVATFTKDDTYKLTWAAFEIGKMIERLVADHANRYENPIPLTAIDFYRIPISSIGFMDATQKRRQKLDRISDSIDVYLKGTIFQMEMTDSVDYTSRVKAPGVGFNVSASGSSAMSAAISQSGFTYWLTYLIKAKRKR